MDTALIRFPPRRLGDGDDLAAARAVEAGVYAAHLLEHSRAPDPRLEQVVRAGEEAALALWAIGLRIAWSRACAIETQTMATVISSTRDMVVVKILPGSSR